MAEVEYYGVVKTTKKEGPFWLQIEQLRRQGYTVLSSDLPSEILGEISDKFNTASKQHREIVLNKVEEQSIRTLFAFDQCFLRLAQNSRLMTVLSEIFDTKFMLNQQNGLVNPPNAKYSEARWHRDLPYQHFVSTKPLGISAVFCIDDFHSENGSTCVLPYSHLFEKFPSDEYVELHQLPITAHAGDFILWDAMTYHKGGQNISDTVRRGFNSFYSIPLIRHQIDPTYLNYPYRLSKEDEAFLGFNYGSAKTVKEFLDR